ncbi:SDR family NAD(P)-dependent oxidoreductase (plasmid) [Novosphingobium sp. BL-8A]|uniref:SDR family NAD(P)-dependent oxidoreductase n=1 Tax=Novosphingobium sp. BL-8A TaxID=3127639 RepID=UPI003756EDC4
MSRLEGKIAIVTGASRGVGKGIALALGEQGATVYVTGRTVNSGNALLPGTIGETAAEVSARGGTGIAIQVDHTDHAQTAALFEQVQTDSGRLDVLVNNLMAIPPAMTDRIGFWEKPLDLLDIFETGINAAYVAAWHAAKIMVPQGSGLIVGISGYVGVTYTYDVAFGTTKSATDRMMRDMAVELKPHGVTALSLWQGFTFTERALENLEIAPGMAEQESSTMTVKGARPISRPFARAPAMTARAGSRSIMGFPCLH